MDFPKLAQAKNVAGLADNTQEEGQDDACPGPRRFAMKRYFRS